MNKKDKIRLYELTLVSLILFFIVMFLKHQNYIYFNADYILTRELVLMYFIMIILFIPRIIDFFRKISFNKKKSFKKRKDHRKELFYSGTENLLFWVAGYRGSSTVVEDVVKEYQKDKNEFISKGAKGKIKTLEITHSRRYKYMRIYYCENITTAPKDAFHITGNDWTMHKWLTD